MITFLENITHFPKKFPPRNWKRKNLPLDCQGSQSVPSQEKLRKQWCLFDQTENIDFNTEVRKITGDFTDGLLGSASELEVYKNLDVRREIEPIFDDFSYNDSGVKKRRQINTQSNKKQKLKKKEARANQTKKVTRVSKNVSVKRH